MRRKSDNEVGKKKSSGPDCPKGYDPEIWRRIVDTDNFFCRMADLVPVEDWGFAEEIKEALRERKHQLVDQKLSSGDRRKLPRAERQKLAQGDQNQLRTVTQVWEWMAASGRGKNTPLNPDKPPDTQATDKETTTKNRKIKSKKTPPVDKIQVASRAEGLRRLHEKIETLKQKRGGKSAVEAEQSRKLKRRVSKLKLKERRAAAKTEPPEKKPKKEPPVQKEVRNSDGELVFSKFDFAVSPADKFGKSKAKKAGKFVNMKLEGKDYKRLLEKVEKRNERLDQLREKDGEKAREIETRIKWDAALQRAQGHKIKDNPKLLKKSLKSREKRKDYSKKKWGKREKTVEDRKQQRQEKRKRNLEARVGDKKKHKLDKARKKGRIV